jgi:hypothetical protein
MSLKCLASKCSRQKSLETAKLLATFTDRKVNNTLHQIILCVQFEPCGRQGSSFHPTGLGVMIPLTAFSILFVSFFSLVCCRTLKSTPTPRCGPTWTRTGRPQAMSVDNALLILYHVHFTSQTQCRVRTFYKKVIIYLLWQF